MKAFYTGNNRTIQSIFIELLVWILIVLSLFINLERVPPLWWDEGWTFSVARNWVELGHYGRLLNGQLYTAGLSGHFPLVALVALSFKLFGVGAWQGRLPCALLTLGALGLQFFLASRLYNRRIAYGALFLLLLTQVSEPLHPIFVGRQVLGEMPALFFLLAGYACLWGVFRRSTCWILPAVLFWGIAIRTKAQVPYFWMVSLLVPMVGALLRRWWKEATVLCAGLVGAWLLSKYGLARIEAALVAGRYIQGQPLQGAFSVLVFVPVLSVRLRALQLALAFCLPALVGVLWSGWNVLQTIRRDDLDPSIGLMRWVLLVFSGAWFAWYLVFGMYWERYVFLANFTGSVFGAAMLYKLTRGFDLRWVLSQASALLRRQPSQRIELRPLFIHLGYMALVLWVVISVFLTLFFQLSWYLPVNIKSTREAAYYLNTVTDENALIETYETELFIYLERPYHYPPDQVSLELERRNYIDPTAPVHYDVLEFKPDYLVTGQQEKEWGLYAPWMEAGYFRLIQEFPGYQVYEWAQR